jgi:P27 family predicted phage terminase small subunit
LKGRKPKPDNVVALYGNPGKRPRNRKQPRASGDLPRAPAYLSKRGAEIFGRLVGRLDAQKLASSSHTEMLGLAAMRLAEVEECSEVIEREGASYETVTVSGGRMVKARPEVAMRAEAARHAHALLVEFGQSPAAANKVTARDDGEEDPAERFFA